MPPTNPVHRCDGECGLLRPCRPHAGRWYCVECHPEYNDDAPHAADSASSDVATDGGTDR